MTVVEINFPPEPWFDPKTGNPTMGFRRFLEDQINNPYQTRGNIGKNLSGVALAQASAEAASEAANAVQVNANSTPSGAMTVTTSSASLLASGLTSAVLEVSATISVAGGTPNYTPSAIKLSGNDITAAFSPSPLTSDGDIVVTFSLAANAAGVSGVYRIDVTDSAGSPLTESVQLSVALFRTDQINP